MAENQTSKTAAKKTVTQRVREASAKRDQDKAAGDYVPTSDLDKDLDAANEEVQDYLEMHSVKQGLYVEENEESEQNGPDAKVEDTSAEATAQEVADGAVEGQKEQRQQRAKERLEARKKGEAPPKSQVSTGSAPKAESKS
jgi:hypothetical protein